MPYINHELLDSHLNGVASCPPLKELHNEAYQELNLNLPCDWKNLFIDLLLTHAPDSFGLDFDSALKYLVALLPENPESNAEKALQKILPNIFMVLYSTKILGCSDYNFSLSYIASIADEILGGLKNCQDGMYERCNRVWQRMISQDSLEHFLRSFRRDIIESIATRIVAREIANNRIHTGNEIHEIERFCISAQELGLNIPVTYGHFHVGCNQYKSFIVNEFPHLYTPIHIIGYIKGRLETLLRNLGYNGAYDDGYQLDVYNHWQRCLENYFGEELAQRQIWVMDEYFERLIDINWSFIVEKIVYQLQAKEIIYSVSSDKWLDELINKESFSEWKAVYEHKLVIEADFIEKAIYLSPIILQELVIQLDVPAKKYMDHIVSVNNWIEIRPLRNNLFKLSNLQELDLEQQDIILNDLMFGIVNRNPETIVFIIYFAKSHAFAQSLFEWKIESHEIAHSILNAMIFTNLNRTNCYEQMKSIINHESFTLMWLSYLDNSMQRNRSQWMVLIEFMMIHEQSLLSTLLLKNDMPVGFNDILNFMLTTTHSCHQLLEIIIKLPKDIILTKTYSELYDKNPLESPLLLQKILTLSHICITHEKYQFSSLLFHILDKLEIKDFSSILLKSFDNMYSELCDLDKLPEDLMLLLIQKINAGCNSTSIQAIKNKIIRNLTNTPYKHEYTTLTHIILYRFNNLTNNVKSAFIIFLLSLEILNEKSMKVTWGFIAKNAPGFFKALLATLAQQKTASLDFLYILKKLCPLPLKQNLPMLFLARNTTKELAQIQPAPELVIHHVEFIIQSIVTNYDFVNYIEITSHILLYLQRKVTGYENLYHFLMSEGDDSMKASLNNIMSRLTKPQQCFLKGNLNRLHKPNR